MKIGIPKIVKTAPKREQGKLKPKEAPIPVILPKKKEADVPSK